MPEEDEKDTKEKELDPDLILEADVVVEDPEVVEEEEVDEDAVSDDEIDPFKDRFEE